MTKELFENIRAVAAVNNNRISEQNLNLLQLKYEIVDMEGCLRFCTKNHIEVYKEECAANELPVIQGIVTSKLHTNPEAVNQNKLAKKITRRIMHIGSVKARKQVSDAGLRGWLCGTYTSKVAERICLRVKRIFSVEEMEYILAHLVEENDEDITFSMVDTFEPELCDTLNGKLNELIPNLHVNIFYD